MTQPEFECWIQFAQRFPFDDYHRFHRPAALISHSMAGADMSKLLEWLQPGQLERPEVRDESDIATMAAFGFKPTRE